MTNEPVHEISNNVVRATSKVSESASAYAQSDQSPCKSLEYSMSVKRLTEHHLEFLSLTGGYIGWSEFTLVKCQVVGNYMSKLKWYTDLHSCVLFSSYFQFTCRIIHGIFTPVLVIKIF